MGLAVNISVMLTLTYYREIMFQNILLFPLLLLPIIVIFVVFDAALIRVGWDYIRIKSFSTHLADFAVLFTFGSNAMASRSIVKEPGSKISWLRLELHPFDKPDLENGIVSDCGLVICRLPDLKLITTGFNIYRYSEIVFTIKGEKGGEQIGISLNSVNGDENKLPLRKVMPADWSITTTPQEVRINLDRFGRATRELGPKKRQRIRCLTFFTNAVLGGNDKIAVLITNLHFSAPVPEAEN
jgi:hypothetical protein